MMQPSGNYKQLRNAIHASQTPCLPYLGIYLTDLTFIEDGNKTVTPEGLINFSKMRLLATVMREVELYQQTPFSFKSAPDVQISLYWLGKVLDEQEAYKKSLELEPRESATPK
eukprot:GFYU01050865.1.p1 GENE.GFYU01050865.1~~GFYU01050865.1.p1  ORF type:complete len:113 (-),score=31.44 GFYU01050865.1:129-467(-)